MAIAVATADAPRTAPDPRPAAVEGPQWRVVASRADIEHLPPGATFVEGRNLGDDDVAALARCRNLRGLRLAARVHPAGSPPLRLLSDAALPHLRAFPHLRVLDFDLQTELTGTGLEVLLALPELEELHFDAAELQESALEVLPRLPALRHLDLALNHGFRTDGMLAIGRLRQLRVLRLDGCSQLNVAMLAPLQQLTALEDLDLGNLGRSWRAMSPGRDTPEARARRQEQRQQAERDRAGLQPDLVQYLPTSLRRLRLAACTFDDDTIRLLTLRLPRLQSVDLSDCRQITDVAVVHLSNLPGLERLDLSRCPGLGRITLDLVQHSRTLRWLGLDELGFVTIGDLEDLFGRGVEVRCRKADPVFADAFAGLLAQWRANAGAPRFQVVRDAAAIAELPADVTAVEGHDLDAEAVAALARRPRLERLRLRYGVQAQARGHEPMAAGRAAGNDASIADQQLLPLRALRRLRSFELAGAARVHGPGLQFLAALPQLEEVRLFAQDTDAAGLQVLAMLPALRSLALEWDHGVDDAGLAALAASRSLRRLRLCATPTVGAAGLRGLGRLTQLEHLALQQLDGVTRRPGAPAVKPGDDVGLTDDALAGLQDLHTLRSLDIAHGRFGNRGLQALRGMFALERLTLDGNPEVQSAAIGLLPPRLAALSLRRCPGLDDGLGAAILDQCPGLQELYLDGNTRLGDDCLRDVLALPALTTLHLHGCSGLGPKLVDLLLDCDRLQELDITGCQGWTPGKVAQLRARGPLVFWKNG